MTTNNTHIHRDSIAKVSEAIDNALVAAVHIMDAEDGINLDVVLVSLAEARAYAVQANIMALVADRVIDATGDQPRTYLDEIPVYPLPKPKPLELPKLQKQPTPSDTRKWEKQRPGIKAKLKSPRAFDCPTCQAEAGTNCFVFTNQGKHGKVTDQRNSGSTYHTARGALSVAHNDRMRREYDRNQAKAMET